MDKIVFFAIIILQDLPTARGYLELETTQGRIRGSEQNFLGKPVRSFLGVPFAEPPIGELRFRPPKRKRLWNGTFVADTLSPACYQERDTTFGAFWGSDMWNANTPVSEDCLYMNIWAPKTTLTKVPVMVWLFGGGFWYGSPSLKLYDGKALAVTGHVVVVNVNYRVGPFGFLYLDHDEVPGNMGLLDQQMALQWIQDNIKLFGGDREKVTLFGESAGAASIVAHMISPGSRNLFNNGILESGSLDNPWAMDTPNKALSKSIAFVNSTNCFAKDSPRLTAKCLRKIPADKLSVALWNVPVGFLEFYLVIVSQDRHFFLEKDAYQSLREGDYRATDLIIGINKDEGNFWNIYYLNDSYKFYPYSQKRNIPPSISGIEFEECVELAFHKLSPLLRKAAAFQYWDKRCTQERNFYLEQANQMIGDYYFTCDSLWLADQLIKNSSKVFIYYFEQISSTNPFPKWMGVLHGYEIEFVFGVPLVNGTRGGYSPGEIQLSKKVIEYWTSFARDGIPRAKHDMIEWPFYDQTDKLWLTLSSNQYGLMKAIKTEECALWRHARDIEYTEYRNSSRCSNQKISILGILSLILMRYSVARLL